MASRYEAPIGDPFHPFSNIFTLFVKINIQEKILAGFEEYISKVRWSIWFL